MHFAPVEALPDTRVSLDASPLLTSGQAQALVRLLEAAPGVVRRHQLFIWLQTYLHPLLPHVLAVCGAYQRQQRGLVFESFHSVALPAPLLASAAATDSPFTGALVRAWIEAGGQARAVGLQDGGRTIEPADARAWREAGLGHLLVHGVSRPQRLHEIESFFVFGGTDARVQPEALLRLDLLMPLLHATSLRVIANERALVGSPRQVPSGSGLEHPPAITARERQILQGVREGKTNQQIGLQLGISALTVKNHVQKILRKLGAHNRAQAVALTLGDDAAAGSDAAGGERGFAD